MKSLLITGLNGLIGWNLYLAASKKYETFGTYRRENLNLPRNDAKTSLYRIDLDNQAETLTLMRNVRPEIIIHSRAICDLDVCEQNPEMAERINIEGTRKILKAAEENSHLQKFVFISTDHVFQGDRGNYTEEDSPHPKHVYGRTRLEAERLVSISGIPFLIMRPGLVIGKSLQGDKGPRDFLLKRIRQEKPTHYFTDEWRTPIAAEEFAARVMALIDENASGIYHVAGDRIYNRFELARKLAEDNGFPTNFIFPRLRQEDRWAHIRPEHLTLKSIRDPSSSDYVGDSG